MNSKHFETVKNILAVIGAIAVVFFIVNWNYSFTHAYDDGYKQGVTNAIYYIYNNDDSAVENRAYPVVCNNEKSLKEYIMQEGVDYSGYTGPIKPSDYDFDLAGE